MDFLFLHYPKCSTCVKAKKKLVEQGISFQERDIKAHPPTLEELKQWVAQSGLPLKKLFNTSGVLYRSMELSKKIPTLSEEEQFQLLASDGMLVKRPILIGKNSVLVGFKQADWDTLI